MFKLRKTIVLNNHSFDTAQQTNVQAHSYSKISTHRPKQKASVFVPMPIIMYRKADQKEKVAA